MKKIGLKIILIGILAVCLCACNKTELQTESDKEKNGKYYEYIKLIEQYEKEYTENDCKYDLVYFNEDSIPELVAGVPGKFVGLYSIDQEGKLHTILEDWPYGSYGNQGYEFLPEEGMIRNINTDYDGLVVTTSYIKINQQYQTDMYSSILLQEGAKEEKDKEIKTQVDKYLEEFGGYFHNDISITKEEFMNQISEEKFEFLLGEMSATEVKEELSDLGR